MAMATPQWDFEWVDAVERLGELAQVLSQEPIISLDTETSGWQTGNERLCLVQIGAPGRRCVYLVDALRVVSWDPLASVLQGESPQIIAHNAKFEEKQFGRFAIKLRGVIDTLTQARMLRPDLPNHTLQTVCRHVLGLELDKEPQTSDWGQRPLSEKQVMYARLDAEIAYAVYAAFADMERQLTVDSALGVDGLMEDLAATIGERLKLTKKIATELALLQAREQMLRETIRTKLIAGEPAYEGPFGRASVSKIKQTIINPTRVRELMPSIAPMAIEESVPRQKLLALMKEHGIPEETLQEVSEITGYIDRLSLSVQEKY